MARNSADLGALTESLRACRLCPRMCGVDRTTGETGFCGADDKLRLGAVCVHLGEEPPITGPCGIVNVFFSRCSLQCPFCQNHQISRRTPRIERVWELEEAAATVTGLLDGGTRSLGLVSPTHVLPQALALVGAVRDRGPSPPVVHNGHGYERVEMLRAAEPFVDVYLPDVKTLDTVWAEKVFQAPDYPGRVLEALREMIRQKGTDLVLDGRGRAVRGVLVRHLVMPGRIADSQHVLRTIARELSPRVHVSLMAQYHPPAGLSLPAGDLARALTQAEYDEVVGTLAAEGLDCGWVQALESRGAYRPDFKKALPFD